MAITTEDSVTKSLNSMAIAEKGNNKVYRSDFKILKFLGKGTYGKVYLVHHDSDSNKFYAMKSIRKGEIRENNTDVRHTRTERDVLVRINHPFLVRLFYAFETKSRIYLVQEFLRGGELFRRIEKESMFLEDVAKFYLAEIVLAIEYLHSLDIIYRDLKSENVLIAKDGHIKLIDFGLSKSGMTEDVLTETFCGTVEYMAPEVISRSGHGKPADWWSLGTFAYDILNGFTPFRSTNRNKLMDKIKKGVVNYPPYMTQDAKDLIRKLLRKSCAKRIGCDEIKSHRFFSDITWDKVYKKAYEPPFVPSSVSDHDVSEFDNKFTSKSPRESTDDSDNSEEYENLFEDFFYSAQDSSTDDIEDDDDSLKDDNSLLRHYGS